MIAPLVAVLLVANPPARQHPVPPSPWPEATVDDEAEDEDAPPRHSRLRALRFGAGAATISSVTGFAPSFDVGVELALVGERLALRLELNGALQYHWGVVGATPSVVWYLLPRALVSPYVAAGLQLGAANITDEALGRTSTGSAALGVYRGAANSNPPETPMGENVGASALGPTPLRFTWGPEATAGAVLRLLGGFALDVGLRYTSVRWRGDRLNGLGAALAVVAPL
jgi:hypothetical protein